MSQEIDAALKKARKALIGDVRNAVVDSRLTRWRDMFLVGRIVREEVEKYSSWGRLVDPITLQPATSRQNREILIERCLQRIGKERGLPDEAVEAAIARVTRERDRNVAPGR